MNYEEAEKLKKSLRSDRYIAKSGNQLRIFIAPDAKADLEQWKIGVPGYWNHGGLLDQYAKFYCRDDRYVLFGLRQSKNNMFSGGVLILKDHPELLKDITPSNNSSF